MGGGNRGISPVVGVVLLVAVAVALSAVSMTFFFSTSDKDDDPAPNIMVEFEQQEHIELFNNPDVVRYQLNMIGGETLNGSKVELRGAENPDQLHGETLGGGDSITITPVEDQIQIVYRDDERVSSVLQTFDVSAGASVEMWDCEQLAQEQSAVALGANPSMPWDFDVEIPPDTVVNCNIETEGSIDIGENAELIGYAKSVDNDDELIDLKSGSVVHDHVGASNRIEADGATVKGDVVGTDDGDDGATIKAEGETIFEAELIFKTEGDTSQLKLRDNATITGDVRIAKGATGNINFGPGDTSTPSNPTIEGGIYTAEEGSHMFNFGNIGPGQNVEYTIEDDSTILLASGFLANIQYATFGGGVLIDTENAGNTVEIEETTFEGDMYVTDENDINCNGNVIIDGQDCGDYNFKDADD